jgi:2-succinyl-6-hydroxy-2,4-cyclohexadiene-1-carboxylate synthase
MLINLSNVSLNIEYRGNVLDERPKLVLIHGFTGSVNDWDPIIPNITEKYQPIAIDVIGHGKSSVPESPEFYYSDAITDQLYELFEKLNLKKIVLMGYSMGGRIALQFAFRYPEALYALILESTSPGIKDIKQRNERLKKDQELAHFLQTHTIEEFIDYWMDLDLFNTQRRFSNEKLSQIKKIRTRNNKTGLANTLLYFSPAQMPQLSDSLSKLKVKTILITGELDSKFTKISSKMAKSIHGAKHKIVKSVGHNTHLEDSKKFLNFVNTFLNDLKIQE